MLFIGIAMMMFLYSCHEKHEKETGPETAEQTVLMYMPWSESGIYKYFLINIEGMERAIADNHGLGSKRVLVFIASERTKAVLLRLNFDGEACVRDTIKRYDFPTPEYTTASGITSVINDVKAAEPAYNYAMVIGCHGMGWLPKGTSVRAPQGRMMAPGAADGQMPLTRVTRYFGGPTGSPELQTDISSLAEGIRNAAIGKMDYILFDDCYMSNIETAYELRNVAKYLIASTCEIMIDGMPYATIGKDLLDMDFKKVCDGFYDYYTNYSYPCGTIGVTDCAEIERMAEIMKRINDIYIFDNGLLDEIQILDGLSPTVFFDFGDYVKCLCKDELLYKEFEEQLARLVPYCRHTGKFFSVFNQSETTITDFSGVTISDPTTNPNVAEYVKQTLWYNATH